MEPVLTVFHYEEDGVQIVADSFLGGRLEGGRPGGRLAKG